MKNYIYNVLKIGDLEYHDKTDYEGVNTKGLDQRKTDNHGGHDLSACLRVPGRPDQCTVNCITHGQTGTQSGYTDPESTGNSNAEKYP